MTVGERIKERRISLGWSQQELAKRAGYSDKTAISKIEHGGNTITLKQVRRVAKAMNIDPMEIVGWIRSDTSVLAAPNNVDANTLFEGVEESQLLGDRKEAYIDEYAKRLYELYREASPEIQKAVDLLLKADKQ